MKNLFQGPRTTPSKKPILGGQKGKWAAIGARNNIYDFLMVGGDALKVTLQKCVSENFRSHRWEAEQRVSHGPTRERGPPSA